MAIKYAFTGNNELLFQAMLSCLLYVVLFSIGLWLDFESRRLKSFVLVSAALIFVYLVYFVASTGSLFYYAAQINETGSRVASYQGFARSVLILGFVLIAFQKRYMSELLCIAMVAFMLFVLGARSEFVGFAFSCLVYMTMRAAREGRKAVVLFLSGLLVFMFVQLYTGEFAFSRHSQLLNISESSSMVARNELSLLAWERILENSFWGGWEAHFENGGKGTYAHNILSVWDTYGFLALLLYFGLLSYPVGYSLKMLIARDKLSSLERALVFLAPCVLLLSLVAKSVYWPIPALMWGIYISCKRQALLAHRGLYC